jgi:hypothetical protein
MSPAQFRKGGTRIKSGYDVKGRGEKRREKEEGRKEGEKERGKREMNGEDDIAMYSTRTPKVNATNRIDDICVYLTTGWGV